jgi:iron(III) transport system substrate-binding protein
MTALIASRRSLAVLLVLTAGGGCLPAHDSEVVVYSALDQEFSEPILADFAASSGVAVRSKFDVESTKTVGLVSAIIEEANRPRCDVLWNNEILHTLRLQKLGLLEPYQLPTADKYPEDFRSPTGDWYGFAARARVLIVNTELLDQAEWPRSIHDLADQRWKGRAGIAKPLFGTTATHAAVLLASWGPQRAREYFQRVRENAAVLSGNKQVALAVSRGQLAFGLTDTDDAIVEMEKGLPVAIVYPDQGTEQMGTLFIPNTVCIIRGSANPENARRLLRYLLTPQIEVRLARGASAQFPLHRDVTERPRVHRDGIRQMKVDFQAAANAWETASSFMQELFVASD